MKFNHQNKNTTQEGFALVEILTAIGIMSFMVVSASKSFVLFNKINYINDLHFKATTYAEEPLEILNYNKNNMFACKCTSDVCNTNTCTRISDSQSCTLSPGYTSCYTEYPKNQTAKTDFILKKVGTNWELEAFSSTNKKIPGDENFSRKIVIKNMKRNNSGQLDSNGTEDIDTKLIEIFIEYNGPKENFTHKLSSLFTAWENL